jgi:steroid 5-alpha reductase family enzyme
MTFIEVYLWAAILILLSMLLIWSASLVLRNASIIDIFWGMGFVLVNALYFISSPQGYPLRKWVIGLLVAVWGLRLSAHIFLRNRGKGEDFRYRTWREEAGPSWWWQSFFKVFLLQGILMWLISIPLLAANFSARPASLTWFDGLGVLIWGIGFAFEAVGDWQLTRFKSNPANRGKLLTAGLWRYTRHPNYFGDALQWWGYYLLAAASGGWWTIYSPVLMTFLLRRVSGVTLLEKSLQAGKPGYQEYTETTNAFIPWFPRKRIRNP